MALDGWGRGSWNEGAWNEFIPLSVTGVQGTTGLGTVVGLPSITANVTGVSATTSVNALSISTTTGAPVTNVVGTTAVGSETVIIGVDVGVTLASLQISQSDVVIVPQCVISLIGLGAIGSTGEELVYSLIVPDQTANWREVA